MQGHAGLAASLRNLPAPPEPLRAAATWAHGERCVLRARCRPTLLCVCTRSTCPGPQCSDHGHPLPRTQKRAQRGQARCRRSRSVEAAARRASVPGPSDGHGTGVRLHMLPSWGKRSGAPHMDASDATPQNRGWNGAGRQAAGTAGGGPAGRTPRARNRVLTKEEEAKPPASALALRCSPQHPVPSSEEHRRHL